MHFLFRFKKFVAGLAVGIAGLFLFAGVASAAYSLNVPTEGQIYTCSGDCLSVETGALVPEVSGACDVANGETIRAYVSGAPAPPEYAEFFEGCVGSVFNFVNLWTLKDGADLYTISVKPCDALGENCNDGMILTVGVSAVAASGGGGWSGTLIVPVTSASTTELMAVVMNFFTDIWDFLIVILAVPIVFIIIRGIILWIRDLR